MKSKTFYDVTRSVWENLPSESLIKDGSIYQPMGDPQGILTINTVIGRIEIEYSYNELQESISYTIKRKPTLVSDDTVWNGIEEAIKNSKY